MVAIVLGAGCFARYSLPLHPNSLGELGAGVNKGLSTACLPDVATTVNVGTVLLRSRTKHAQRREEIAQRGPMRAPAPFESSTL